MIFAQTERLVLRTLEKSELPRLVKLIGEWDVVRWLSVVPFPYTLRDAEEFYDDIEPSYVKGDPQFFTVALKTNNLLIGGIGLHPPRGQSTKEGESEIGYWLGKEFWGQGFLTEAARKVIDLGFARESLQVISATTALNNQPSQNILRKLGLTQQGVKARDYTALRGDDQIISWQLTRDAYEKDQKI